METEEEEVRDAVLVTDGDNEIGQVGLILSLNQPISSLLAITRDGNSTLPVERT